MPLIFQIVNGLILLAGAGTLFYALWQKFVKKVSRESVAVAPWCPQYSQLAGFVLFFVFHAAAAGTAGIALAKFCFGEATVLNSVFFAQSLGLVFVFVFLFAVPAIFPPFSFRTFVIKSPKVFGSVLLMFFAAEALVGMTAWISSLVPELFPMLREFWEQDQSIVAALGENRDWRIAASVFVAVVVFTPVIEEIVFRFALYRFMKGALRGGVPAAVFTAVLFALMHDSGAAWLPLAALSCVLSYAYEKTGKLLAPVIIHALFNAWSFAAIVFGQQ